MTKEDMFRLQAAEACFCKVPYVDWEEGQTLIQAAKWLIEGVIICAEGVPASSYILKPLTESEGGVQGLLARTRRVMRVFV